MWLKFYDHDKKMDFVINSDKISFMIAIKNSITWRQTTEVYLSDGYHIPVEKPIEEIMKMIEEGEDANDTK